MNYRVIICNVIIGKVIIGKSCSISTTSHRCFSDYFTLRGMLSLSKFFNLLSNPGSPRSCFALVQLAFSFRSTHTASITFRTISGGEL